MLDKIHPSYKKTTTTTNNKNNNFTALWDVTLYHLVSTCTDSLRNVLPQYLASGVTLNDGSRFL